jgi:glycosyltransferase involved in cell wall biosynthesis
MNDYLSDKVSVVVCARNEDERLAHTLQSLFRQTIKPYEIIVVDDGSIDDTSKVASLFDCKIIKLPFHQDSFVGRPELAVRFNIGLSKVSCLADYVLIMGADSILPTNYLDCLLLEMKLNSNLKIVSGCIPDEDYDSNHPRGSGRLVDAYWWQRVNRMRYPVVWGWEVWLQYKALMLGYEVKSCRHIMFNVSRKSNMSLKQVWNHGYSMNALGYFWIYALARCVSRGPKYGKAMLTGWLRGYGIEKLDVADYVYSSQKKRLFSKIKYFVMEKHL